MTIFLIITKGVTLLVFQDYSILFYLKRSDKSGFEANLEADVT